MKSVVACQIQTQLTVALRWIVDHHNTVMLEAWQQNLLLDKCLYAHEYPASVPFLAAMSGHVSQLFARSDLSNNLVFGADEQPPR